jgi:hypothetical protein
MLFVIFTLRHRPRLKLNVCGPLTERNMLVDSSVREKIRNMKHDFELIILKHKKITLNKKRKTIEDNPVHIDIRTNADRMARVRRMAREVQEAENIQN